MMQVPRLIIGAPHGRSGKTTLTLGLLRALNRSGEIVQPFKKGPDYIDPGWHSIAAGRESRNLDTFFMDSEQIRRSLLNASQGSRLSIIEGAMGLYDGLDLNGSSSTAEIAKITQSPVLMVLDVTRMTRTAAALIMGCQHFDPEIKITGVILNKVVGMRQEKLIRQAIENFCHIPVIGTIPKDCRVVIPDRHLGLVSSTEWAEREKVLEELADIIAGHVDLKAVLALADSAEMLSFEPEKEALSSEAEKDELSYEQENLPEAGAPVRSANIPSVSVLGPDVLNADVSGVDIACANAASANIAGANVVGDDVAGASVAGAKRPCVAVLKDPVFCFYYPENLLALEDLGAELVMVNSLTADALPESVDALYIGGGFPEMFAAQLESNTSLRSHIKTLAENDLPIYAECGGLMYLGRSLICDGQEYGMVGALPLDTVMECKRQGHGYTLLSPCAENTWFSPDIEVKGHEFHYSRIINLNPELKFGYKVLRGHGIDGEHDGIIYKGIHATYNHIHAGAVPEWAKSFFNKAYAYKLSTG